MFRVTTCTRDRMNIIETVDIFIGGIHCCNIDFAVRNGRMTVPAGSLGHHLNSQLPRSLASPKSQAAYPNEEPKGVPSAVVVDCPNCHLIHEKTDHKGGRGNDAMPQSSKKTIGMACFTSLHVLNFGTGGEDKQYKK